MWYLRITRVLLLWLLQQQTDTKFQERPPTVKFFRIRLHITCMRSTSPLHMLLLFHLRVLFHFHMVLHLHPHVLLHLHVLFQHNDRERRRFVHSQCS